MRSAAASIYWRAVSRGVRLVFGGPKSVGMVEVGFRRKYNRNVVEVSRSCRRVCNCADSVQECGSWIPGSAGSSPPLVAEGCGRW